MIFQTEGLLSKWGFGDGDMLDDLLDFGGFSWTDRSHFTQTDEDGVLHSFEHIVLFVAVAAYVVPRLDQRVDLDLISTIHNPVRAERVDGRQMDYPEDKSVTLTPGSVEVPDETILALARALYRPAEVRKISEEGDQT